MRFVLLAKGMAPEESAVEGKGEIGREEGREKRVIWVWV